MNAAVRPNYLKRAVLFAKLNRRFEIMCRSPNGVKLRLNSLEEVEVGTCPSPGGKKGGEEVEFKRLTGEV